MWKSKCRSSFSYSLQSVSICTIALLSASIGFSLRKEGYPVTTREPNLDDLVDLTGRRQVPAYLTHLRLKPSVNILNLLVYSFDLIM